MPRIFTAQTAFCGPSKEAKNLRGCQVSKTNLKSLTLNQLEEFMKQIAEPTYRAKQVFKWIYKGETQFEKMTDLPRNLIKNSTNVLI